MYVWERRDWPAFRWRDSELIEPLATARLSQGRLLGRMQSLGFDLQLEAQLQATAEEILKSSDIEGEVLDDASVRSSLARRLGAPGAVSTTADRRTEAIVEMMLDATRDLDAPLTAGRLCGWQAALFPTGYSGLAKIKTGGWRQDASDPMTVVSGSIGRARVHYQAPPAARMGAEMTAFLDWYGGPPAMDGLLRAGLAHLWFVTIHPFEDGNGRIARVVADQALAQSERSPQRFYSMSSQIRRERARYYAILEQTQRGDLDPTAWLHWFLACFTRAVEGAGTTSLGVLRKAEFWRAHDRLPVSERQRSMLNRYLDGFEGHLTAKKWAILGKCSPASAQRDIADLVAKGVLLRNSGGSKNTSYAIVGSE